MNLTAYTKEFSANFRLAYPVILGMLGHTLIGLVDNIMVGRLGTTELAAVSLGNSFVFVAMSAGIGFSTALTPIVAQGDAAKDSRGIRAALHHGLLLCTLIGFFLFTMVYFATPLMDAMGQPREVIAMARPFIGWVGFSILPAMMFQGYKQFADGMSQTKYDMYAVVFSNVIHIGLNYLLIYGVWGLPKLGIMGAALGTVISRIALVLYMHFALTNDKKLKPYFTGFSLGEFKMAMIKKIASLGILSSMQMLFEVALFTSAVWLSGFLGKTSQAANQIALSLASLTFMFAMGLSVTAMIRIGNQKGLKDYVNLRRIARSIILMAIIVEAVFALLFIALHNVLPYLFINSENIAHVADTGEVIAIAAKLLIIAAVFQLSDGLQVVVLGTLRGLQDVKIPTIITFIAYWVVGFPLCYFLGVHTRLGAIGIWIGLLAGLTAAALFLYLRFNYLTKRLISNDEQL